MKNILSILFILLTIGMANAQKDFEWDVVSDAPGESKEQLYSKAKLVVAESFKSAQDVIQNDDREGGILLVKASSVITSTANLHVHTAVFKYTIKIYVKDNKYRIKVENVYGESSRVGNYDWPAVPVSDKYPEKGGKTKTGFNSKKYYQEMTMLRNELQSIVDYIQSEMNKPFEVEEDW